MSEDKNKFVRVTALLFIRFTSPPKQVIKRIEPFLKDNSVIDDSQTLGEFANKILNERQLAENILFPRLPQSKRNRSRSRSRSKNRE